MARQPAPMNLDTALDEAAAGRRAVVKHRGRRVALLPAADLVRLEELEDAAAARAALEEGPARPYDELRERLGLK